MHPQPQLSMCNKQQQPALHTHGAALLLCRCYVTPESLLAGGIGLVGRSFQDELEQERISCS